MKLLICISLYLISTILAELKINQFVTDVVYRHSTLSLAPYDTLFDTSLLNCGIKCLRDASCQSITLVVDSDGSKTCHLYNSSFCSQQVRIESSVNSTIYDKLTSTLTRNCYRFRCLIDINGQLEKSSQSNSNGLTECLIYDLCPKGYLFYVDACIKLEITQKSYNDAEQSCKSVSNTCQLAPIRRLETNNALASWLAQSGLQQAYIGVKNVDGVYMDAEGLLVPVGDEVSSDPGARFTSWKVGWPLGAFQSAVVISQYNYRWNDQFNSTSFSFFCQLPVNSNCTVYSAYTIAPDKTCYTLHPATTNSNFATAISYCKSIGGEMAAPQTLEANNLLIDLAKSHSEIAAPIYIGVLSSKTEANGMYLDGTPVPFPPPWSGGEPNYLAFDSAVLRSNGEWVDGIGGFLNPFVCEYIAKDCWEWQKRGHNSTFPYRIKPEPTKPSFQAYCDMTTDNTGWTIIQTRLYRAVQFNRPTGEYENGFGNIGSEIWLGNDVIHHLTRFPSQLMIEITDTDSNIYRVKYPRFQISSKATNYTLTISNYPGIVDDDLSLSNGSAFTNCLETSHICCENSNDGGWWFPSKNCTRVNLNSNNGIKWNDIKVMKTIMKITRV